MRNIVLVSVVAALVGCGGGSSSGSSSSSGPGNATAGGEPVAGAPVASPTPEVDELHDDLAPVFHMEAGAARATATCEHAERFGALSRAVQGATVPEGGDAAAWATAGTNLVAAADAVGAECTAAGPAVEERLTAFHDAFHAVLDAAGTRSTHEADPAAAPPPG
jgi:hypothetical protein